MKSNRNITHLTLAALTLFAVVGCTKDEVETRWPTVTLHAPSQALQGVAVTMSLDITTGTEPLVEASFDFDGNGTADTVLLNPPVGTWTVSHAFAARGWPMVKGQVVDAAGRRVTDSLRVTVTRGAPPVVEILAPASAIDSATIRFVVTRGGYPLQGFTYAAQSNGGQWTAFDSTAQSDAVTVYTGIFREFGPSEQVTLTARVWDQLGQVDSARATLYLAGPALP